MPSQQEQLGSLAYRNFIQTCRSPATRRIYKIGLHQFMNYLHIPEQEYDRLLDKDRKLIQMDICDYITYMREKNTSSSSISTYLAAIRHFYDMNDIEFHWKKIHSFEGEKEKNAEDRPYTHSEIKLLLDHTTLRNRAIILVMASAGLRVGAIPQLRIKDLEPIDNYKIYKINVYAKSKQRYFSFCTPEARREIDNYLEYRRRWGERLKDETPLFRRDYNSHEPSSSPAFALSEGRIRNFVMSISRDCGLRQVSSIENYRYQRSPIMTNHGFRKFFETNAFKAGMDHMYLRRLMGQRSGLEDSYLKLSEEELLEGDSKHIGYIGVIFCFNILLCYFLRRAISNNE